MPLRRIVNQSLVAYQNDARHRLSSFWTPTLRQQSPTQEPDSGHDLLVRAGFLRQAHAGVYHLLPLGLRVQNKVESLIDKHMSRIGASKASLSSISSEHLWQRSGRLDKTKGSEFLTFQDRKGAKYLLSPTHEEEITTIVADAVHSYKDLPLRLYQVTRKYRDEPRPRQGLLRAREFVMKDLYTFDSSEKSARVTYEEVRGAYAAFFDELKLPYLVATADSGNMGGDLSHEYHFASPLGEDIVISCDTCDYIVNEEKHIGHSSHSHGSSIWTAVFLSRDKKSAVCAVWPGDSDDLNVHVVKRQFPALDMGSRVVHELTEAPLPETDFPANAGITYLVDPRLPQEAIAKLGNDVLAIQKAVASAEDNGRASLLTRAKSDDPCPRCDKGRLRLQQAVEIGHTFHLGTRYSVPLNAVALDANNEHVNVSMGCHGVGVSRLISAASSLLADKKGLNWPLAIAPFGSAVIPGPDVSAEDANSVYDILTDQREMPNADAVVDDRQKPLGWKLNDADLIGYPFVVVLGRAWKSSQRVELQCRRLGIKENVGLSELQQRVQSLVQQL